MASRQQSAYASLGRSISLKSSFLYLVSSRPTMACFKNPSRHMHRTLPAIFMGPRRNRILRISSFWTIMIILFSCDNLQSGQQLYKSGLENFKSADHGDYHDQVGLRKAINDVEKAIEKGFKARDV